MARVGVHLVAFALTFHGLRWGFTSSQGIEANLSAAGLSYLLWGWDGDGSADDNPSSRANLQRR